MSDYDLGFFCYLKKGIKHSIVVKTVLVDDHTTAVTALLPQLYHTMAELHALCWAMSFGQQLDVEHFDNM